MKCIALSVLMFETLQTVLITRDGFRIFGAGWGDEAALTKVGWIWFSVPAMSALSASHSTIVIMEGILIDVALSRLWCTDVLCVADLHAEPPSLYSCRRRIGPCNPIL